MTRVSCWNALINDVIKLNRIVGVIIGSVMEKNCLAGLAPSREAASYKSMGMLLISV